MTPDPKPGVRRSIVEPRWSRIWTSTHTECVACGIRGTNAAHVLARGDGGDDVPENFVTLCGSGSHGCHGAYHGSPYVAHPGSTPDYLAPPQRRDRAWVAERIGAHIVADRHEIIEYVLWKLGAVAGRHYLWFHYAIAYPVDADAARIEP